LARPDLVVSSPSVTNIIANQNGSGPSPWLHRDQLGHRTAQSSWFDIGYSRPMRRWTTPTEQQLAEQPQHDARARGNYQITTRHFTTSTTTGRATTPFFIRRRANSATGGTNTDTGNLTETSETTTHLGGGHAALT